jgi:hypothetical protein
MTSPINMTIPMMALQHMAVITWARVLSGPG